MKNKKKLITIIIVVLLVIALGVAAFCIIDNRIHSENDTKKDLLVGVFLTPDSVFESEAYAKLKGEDDRYYATLKQKTVVDEETGAKRTYSEYEFEGLNGYSFYYYRWKENDVVSTMGIYDDAFCKLDTSFDVGRAYSRVMKATVYMTGEEVSFRLNPVYQDSDGKIYTILEDAEYVHGIGWSTEVESFDSIWIFDGLKPEKWTTEINIEVKHKDLVKESSFTQFTNENEKIKTDTFKLGETPPEYPLSEETDYIIVDTVYIDEDGDEYTEKELVRIGEDELYLYTLDANGIYSRWYL